MHIDTTATATMMLWWLVLRLRMMMMWSKGRLLVEARARIWPRHLRRGEWWRWVAVVVDRVCGRHIVSTAATATATATATKRVHVGVLMIDT